MGMEPEMGMKMSSNRNGKGSRYRRVGIENPIALISTVLRRISESLWMFVGRRRLVQCLSLVNRRGRPPSAALLNEPLRAPPSVF